MVNIIPNNNEIYSMTKDFLKSDSQQGCKFLYITYDGRSFSVKGTDNKDDLEGVEIPQSLIDKFMDKFSIEITDQKTSTESKEEITRLVNCKNKLSKAKQSSSIFAPVFSAYGYLKSLYTKKKP